MVQEQSKNPILALDAQNFKAKIENKCLVIDTRFISSILKLGSIPNALFIGSQGSLEKWADVLIRDKSSEIYLITEENSNINELLFRFQSAGFYTIKGYLEGGFNAWIQAKYPIEKYQGISPKDFVDNFETVEIKSIIDVRTEIEFQQQRINGTVNIPLEELQNKLDKFKKENQYYILCLGGYRSIIAASILKRNTILSTIDIYGGIKNFP